MLTGGSRTCVTQPPAFQEVVLAPLWQSSAHARRNTLGVGFLPELRHFRIMGALVAYVGAGKYQDSRPQCPCLGCGLGNMEAPGLGRRCNRRCTFRQQHKGTRIPMRFRLTHYQQYSIKKSD